MRQGGTEVSTAIAVSLRAHLGCIKKHWKKLARENDLMWFRFSSSPWQLCGQPETAFQTQQSNGQTTFILEEELKALCTEGNMERVLTEGPCIFLQRTT